MGDSEGGGLWSAGGGGGGGGDTEAEADIRGMFMEGVERGAFGVGTGTDVTLTEGACLVLPDGTDEAWLFIKSTSLLL